jgi:hypothetical protein
MIILDVYGIQPKNDKYCPGIYLVKIPPNFTYKTHRLPIWLFRANSNKGIVDQAIIGHHHIAYSVSHNEVFFINEEELDSDYDIIYKQGAINAV